MAGRNHLREIHLARAPLPGHPALIEDHRARGGLHRLPMPHPALIEEHIDTQHREIQSLLLDNQRLAATHVALKQELAAAQQDLRHLSAAAADVKAERDAHVREVYERSLKMEAEVRSMDALDAELAQVRADVHKLTAVRQELAVKLQAIDGDLVMAGSELEQLPAIRAEIETMRHEIQRGRAAVEYEKKTHSNNLEQDQAMEKNMISMAREIEKLQAELANAEKRARAAAAAVATPSAGYAASYGNPEMGYGRSSYPDPYAMHQVQGGADPGPQYGSGVVPHGPYDMQRTHVHR
uniref:Protein FLX-like 1 n=1 Tax=Davidia involucrata TaxID=16924 RepID=A0A5B6YPG6_DAVIN